jgi:uncharacterized protein with PQ loop repeat
MHPIHATPHVPLPPSSKMMTFLLGGLSVFTMVMTVPQVLTIWVDHLTAGVSLISWSGYLFAAVIWFWYGIQKRDRNIYLPCVGWIALDAAVVAGILVHG